MTDSLKVAVTETLSPAFNRLFCTPEALLIATLPLTVGAIVSMVKVLTDRLSLVLLAFSVTEILQLL
jgi:hypothetical protein